VFHKGGKLTLDGAFGVPDETPVENVRAMFAAAKKYGR
jgi:uroporphyrinogen-III decarboxylase